MLQPHWVDAVRRRRWDSTLFIAEGLLMFLTPDDVRALILRLAERFPGSELLAESVAPNAGTRPGGRHPLAPVSTPLRWVAGDLADVASWDPRIELVDQWSFLDRHPRGTDRPRLLARLTGSRFTRSRAEPHLVVGHLRFHQQR